DSIALVIRWGRTERQFVQFALEALRNASVSTIAVILNDIDLKAQRRSGYRDRTLVYTDKGLYRVAPGYREPTTTQASLPKAVAEPDAHSETSVLKPRARDTLRDRPRPAESDIERLYNRFHEQ